MFANRRYYLADHQNGETAHYPSAAQAMAAAWALAELKARAQGMAGVYEQESCDGRLYFGIAELTQDGPTGRILLSVGRLH
jgi:hypothetical protein